MLWMNCRKLIGGLIWASFLCFSSAIFADVPAYPPPSSSIQTISQAPNTYPLNYNGRTMTIPGIDGIRNGQPVTVNQFSRVSGGSGGLTGYKTNPVNLTDNYGNVARGQVQTQTQIPGAGSSVMNKAITGLIVGDMAGRVLNSPAAQNAAKALGEGNYAEGALSAGAAFDVFDVGSGLNTLKDIFVKAQEAKTASVIQAREEFAKNYDEVKNLPEVYVVYLGYKGGQELRYPGYGIYGIYKEAVGLSNGRIVSVNKYPDGKGGYTDRVFGTYPFVIDGVNVSYRVMSVAPTPELFQRPITPEELMLSTAEMQQIVLQQLANQNSALNKNTEAMTQLINALWAGGHLGPGNTQTMVSGSPADNTFLTSPYTPAGSNQAQQTQFTINNNGTVSQTIINRPDLAANTSQAPTRAEVGNQQQQGQQDTRPAKSDSTAEKPDICAQNPNSLMCAPMGNTDYQDLVLPQQNINIALSPLHIFNTDAACPAPTSFSIAGTQQRMSYEPMCDTARKARPFIIMMAMTAAFLMVFSALNRR